VNVHPHPHPPPSRGREVVVTTNISPPLAGGDKGEGELFQRFLDKHYEIFLDNGTEFAL